MLLLFYSQCMWISATYTLRRAKGGREMNPTKEENGEIKTDFDEIRRKRLAHQSIAAPPPSPATRIAGGQDSSSMELESFSSSVISPTLNSAPTTPAKKGADLNARSLNLLIEQIFLLSLRKDAISPLKIVECGDDSLDNKESQRNCHYVSCKW